MDQLQELEYKDDPTIEDIVDALVEYDAGKDEAFHIIANVQGFYQKSLETYVSKKYADDDVKHWTKEQRDQEVQSFVSSMLEIYQNKQIVSRKYERTAVKLNRAQFEDLRAREYRHALQNVFNCTTNLRREGCRKNRLKHLQERQTQLYKDLHDNSVREENEYCPLCMEMRRHEMFFELECSHRFCLACFPEGASCPMCRGPLKVSKNKEMYKAIKSRCKDAVNGAVSRCRSSYSTLGPGIINVDEADEVLNILEMSDGGRRTIDNRTAYDIRHGVMNSPVIDVDMDEVNTGFEFAHIEARQNIADSAEEVGGQVDGGPAIVLAGVDIEGNSVISEGGDPTESAGGQVDGGLAFEQTGADIEERGREVSRGARNADEHGSAIDLPDLDTDREMDGAHNAVDNAESVDEQLDNVGAIDLAGLDTLDIEERDRVISDGHDEVARVESVDEQDNNDSTIDLPGLDTLEIGERDRVTNYVAAVAEGVDEQVNSVSAIDVAVNRLDIGERRRIISAGESAGENAVEVGGDGVGEEEGNIDIAHGQHLATEEGNSRDLVESTTRRRDMNVDERRELSRDDIDYDNETAAVTPFNIGEGSTAIDDMSRNPPAATSNTAPSGMDFDLPRLGFEQANLSIADLSFLNGLFDTGPSSPNTAAVEVTPADSFEGLKLIVVATVDTNNCLRETHMTAMEFVNMSERPQLPLAHYNFPSNFSRLASASYRAFTRNLLHNNGCTACLGNRKEYLAFAEGFNDYRRGSNRLTSKWYIQGRIFAEKVTSAESLSTAMDVLIHVASSSASDRSSTVCDDFFSPSEKTDYDAYRLQLIADLEITLPPNVVKPTTSFLKKMAKSVEKLKEFLEDDGRHYIPINPPPEKLSVDDKQYCVLLNESNLAVITTFVDFIRRHPYVPDIYLVRRGDDVEWGAFTKKKIPRGQLLDVYAGDVRARKTFRFFSQYKIPQKDVVELPHIRSGHYFLDPTILSNLGRYLNGVRHEEYKLANVIAMPVFCSGTIVLVLVAVTDIEEDTELLWHYGTTPDSGADTFLSIQDLRKVRITDRFYFNDMGKRKATAVDAEVSRTTSTRSSAKKRHKV